MTYLERAGVRLEDLSPADAARIHLVDLLALRTTLYERCMARIDDGPDVQINGGPAQSCGAHIRDWAAAMEATHGSPTVRVHQHPGLPWATALMVVVWGEAPINDDGKGGWAQVWPGEWTPQLVGRALTWQDGTDIPGAVTGRLIMAPSRTIAIASATLSDA